MRLERLGTVVLVLVAVVVVGVVGVSAAWKLAADDLFAWVDEAQGDPNVQRGQPGIWLSARLSADVAPDDVVARRARADQLGARSDRLRELAGVAALFGLLVAVFTGRAEIGTGRDREPSMAAANTASNGTA